jgi:hypothetical protein
MRHLLPFLLLALCAPLHVMATHVRGGEIRYTYVGPVPSGDLYDIEVHLYLDPGAPADRPEVILHIGNTTDTVPRTDSIPLPGCPGTVHCIYTTTHVFTGFGAYLIRVEDPNRIGGTLNIPDSFDEALALSAELEISSFGPNSSVRFDAPQTEQGLAWSTLEHDPLATDPDGDSLSFELVTPLGDGFQPIAGYMLPDAVSPVPGGYTWVDPATGVFLWDRPALLGNYQIAIRCTERRLVGGNWFTVGEVTRDMSLCIGQLPTGIAAPSTAAGPWLLAEGRAGHYRVDAGAVDGIVSVCDVSGRLAMQRSAQGTLDLSGLPDGIYQVTLRTGEGTPRTTRIALAR